MQRQRKLGKTCCIMLHAGAWSGSATHIISIHAGLWRLPTGVCRGAGKLRLKAADERRFTPIRERPRCAMGDMNSIARVTFRCIMLHPVDLESCSGMQQHGKLGKTCCIMLHAGVWSGSVAHIISIHAGLWRLPTGVCRGAGKLRLKAADERRFTPIRKRPRCAMGDMNSTTLVTFRCIMLHPVAFWGAGLTRVARLCRF